MAAISYLNMTMDDIVFDNRNKAYGAYQLRKIEDLKDKQIGDKDIKGDDNAKQNIESIIDDKPAVEENKVWTFVEQSPEFPGGENALRAYIVSHANYCEMERDNGIEGKVYIR